MHDTCTIGLSAPRQLLTFGCMSETWTDLNTTISLGSGQCQDTQKRARKQRKPQPQPQPQTDGAVSDSVVNPMGSFQSKKASKPRHQSEAVPVASNENTNMSKANGHKPRHASAGVNMIPNTPYKEQAYAGPTFSASPAPSSLPVPKFFSRAVPNVAAHQQSMEARLVGEKTQEGEQSSPESVTATPPPRASQQSPLDVFFNADRAEKEKRNSGSMLSPETAARPPPATEPRNSFQQSGKSIFLREMDGEDGPMVSPKTVPPSSRPALLHRASSSPGVGKVGTDSESERDMYTKNLKALLMSNANGTPQKNTSPAHQRPLSSGRPADNMFQTPSPFQRSTSGPSTPAPSTDQQNNYALHYGNRNLSPLFKAARSETPPRPSSLRQQESANETPPWSQNGMNPAQPQQMPRIDPDSFSRNYLDHTIRSTQPVLPPNLPVNVNQTHSSNAHAGNAPAPVSQNGVQAANASSRVSTGGGNTNGIKTMEDDLRRMLKLNVLNK